MKKKLKLVYYKAPRGNVGDDLNAEIWPRLIGDVFDDTSATAFLGIGSILDGRHEEYERKIVFGSGARSQCSIPDITKGGWDVRFVRGPNTAKALGMSDSGWISDPAILAPIAYHNGRNPNSSVIRRIGLVPYFETDPVYAEMISNSIGAKCIHITHSPERFIAELTSCTHIIAEAMHGAILADAYRIPWIPCRITNHDNEKITHNFKWSDWMMSLDVDSDFVSLPRVWRNLGVGILDDMKALVKVRISSKMLRKQISSSNWQLSESAILMDRQCRILEEIERLKADIL